MKNGVPYDVASEWSEARRFAAGVFYGEYRGMTYDWHTQSWKEPK
jgi:hypothetical protein